jgi:hypothetical protein
MFIALVCALITVTAILPVTVFLLTKQMRQAREEAAYARGAAQEFCRLTGDSDRMLRKVVRIYACDPELLQQAVNSLPVGERNNIKLERESGVIQNQCEQIEKWTAKYSDFIGQTPLPGEVGVARF